jgi:hypothetical protein
LFGKNPRKQNSFSQSPLATTAKSAAFEPLNTSYAIPFFIAKFTSSAPGSLIPGMPASLKNATFLSKISSSILDKISSSLCVCSEINFCIFIFASKRVFNRFMRDFATLVSSQKSISHSCKTLKARSEISLKFPIGVGTKYSKGLF